MFYPFMSIMRSWLARWANWAFRPWTVTVLWRLIKSILQSLFSSTRRWQKPRLPPQAHCVLLLKMTTCWADVCCPTCQSWSLHLTLVCHHMAPWRLLAWDWKSSCADAICPFTRERGGGESRHFLSLRQGGTQSTVWTGCFFLSLLLGLLDVATCFCFKDTADLEVVAGSHRQARLLPTFHGPWSSSSSLVQTFCGDKYTRLRASRSYRCY